MMWFALQLQGLWLDKCALAGMNTHRPDLFQGPTVQDDLVTGHGPCRQVGL